MASPAQHFAPARLVPLHRKEGNGMLRMKGYSEL